MEKKSNLISIVIPAYNEEEAIGEDLDRIRATMEASGYDYEVIVVDDGSTDRTGEIVRQRPWVRLIHGKGSGVLRQVVRQALRDHPLISSYRPGDQSEGGEGVTVARLALG